MKVIFCEGFTRRQDSILYILDGHIVGGRSLAHNGMTEWDAEHPEPYVPEVGDRDISHLWENKGGWQLVTSSPGWENAPLHPSILDAPEVG